jgi:segregation and condensation protein B
MEKCMTEERQQIPDSQNEILDNTQDEIAGVQEPEEPMDDGRGMMDEPVAEIVLPVEIENNNEMAVETASTVPAEEIAEAANTIESVESVEQASPDITNQTTPQEQLAEVTLESVIEAVLFASDEPLTPAKLADIAETSSRQVNELVKKLNEKYQANNHSFRIEQIAGGYQMLTLNCYNHWLKQLVRARSESKLSPAALETLAIIAYKQPIIRADIEAIRGVAVGEVIRSLSYKGLVKIVGRAEVLGRPMLYGTTKTFLEVFGLNSLKDLPKIEELKKPTQ